jgi:OOP family OmpA-OmpF porin
MISTLWRGSSARIRFFALAASAMLPVAAPAQDNGIFIGAAAVDATAEYDWFPGIIAGSADEDTNGFKLMGGVRPFDAFAIEASYSDFGGADWPTSILCIQVVGNNCPTSASIDSRAVAVSALGIYTLPLLDFYGRIGLARWEADGRVGFTIPGGGLNTPRRSIEGTDPVYGVGLQIRFSSIALRVEYESFEILDDSTEAISVGFTYTFL